MPRSTARSPARIIARSALRLPCRRLLGGEEIEDERSESQRYSSWAACGSGAEARSADRQAHGWRGEGHSHLVALPSAWYQGASGRRAGRARTGGLERYVE